MYFVWKSILSSLRNCNLENLNDVQTKEHVSTFVALLKLLVLETWREDETRFRHNEADWISSWFGNSRYWLHCRSHLSRVGLHWRVENFQKSKLLLNFNVVKVRKILLFAKILEICAHSHNTCNFKKWD